MTSVGWAIALFVACFVLVQASVVTQQRDRLTLSVALLLFACGAGAAGFLVWMGVGS